MDSDLERVAAALRDHYRVEAEVGRGGVATVYRAVDLRHHRVVAIKVLGSDLPGSSSADRFLREIEITAGLSHPNVVPLFDSGRANGVTYFVMPYLEGRSLRERIEREGQLSVAEAVRIASEVAEALVHAHAHGVIHRDVKPENILLAGGHAMVTDFGVARAVEQAVGPTTTGIAIGTPLYMSPEQASAGTLDERSDIYSLGCVLYEMLAGEPPFRGRTSVAVAARHLREPPPALSIVRPSVTPELEAVVQQALAKAPADRFRTAQDFLDALRIVAVTTGSLSGTDSALLRGVLDRRRASRRRRGVVGVTVAAAGVAALAYVGSRWSPLGGPDLARTRVVVFPLAERGEGSEIGADAALAIGMALEHTDPLKWIDGWSFLSPDERADARLVTADRQRAIARDRGSMFYVSGAVLSGADTVSVSLFLHDALADSVVDRASATGASGDGSAGRLGLQALVRLLPALIEPTRTVDLAHLTDRDPRALTLWIQGEREYRMGRFDAALALFDRAVEADSLLALAALKGAQAAGWMDRPEVGRALADVALRHRRFLPPRHVALAEGFVHYIEGEADVAVASFREALAGNPDWAEASTLLGETYHHLIPSDLAAGESAPRAFEEASALDSDFIPPRIHLAEYALWDHDLAAAEAHLRRIRDSETVPERTRPLEILSACARDGPDDLDWVGVARREAQALLEAAKLMSTGAAYTGCADRAFRAIASTPEAVPSLRWGAQHGLHGLLVLAGRYEEARAVIGTAIADGAGAARLLHIMDVYAGSDSGRDADELAELVRSLTGGSYAGVQARTQWLVGAWLAHRGRSEELSRLENALRASMDPETPSFLTAIAGWRALADGDTTRALVLLSSIPVTGTRTSLAYDIGAGFPAERLVAACIHQKRGEYAEAAELAASLEHPQPTSYVPFLAASLRLRMEAARGLGDDSAHERIRARLLDLGRSDLIAREPCPSLQGAPS